MHEKSQLNNVFEIPNDLLEERDDFDPTLFDRMNDGATVPHMDHETLFVAPTGQPTPEYAQAPEAMIATLIMRTGERLDYERSHFGLAA